MGTYAWNKLYSKILPAKSRPPRAFPVGPSTEIWLRALRRTCIVWNLETFILQKWQKVDLSASGLT